MNCNFEGSEGAIVILYKERIKISSPSSVVSLKISIPSQASSASKAMADNSWMYDDIDDISS